MHKIFLMNLHSFCWFHSLNTIAGNKFEEIVFFQQIREA